MKILQNDSSIPVLEDIIKNPNCYINCVENPTKKEMTRFLIKMARFDS